MPDLDKVEKAVYGSCIDRIAAASNGAISKSDAKALLKNLNQIKKLVMALNPNGNIQDVLKQVLPEALRAIKVGRLQAAFQAAKQKETFKNKATLVNAIPKASDQLKAFYGMLLGTWREKNSGRFSTDLRMASAVNQAGSKLELALREQNLLDHFTKGIDEDKVAKELSELNTKGGKPGVTNNKDALTIAKVIHNITNEHLEQGERSGIFVPKKQAYSSQQTHDPDTIRQAGFDTWVKDIMPRLDKYETFGTLPQKEWTEFMRNKYLNITSGRHLNYEEGVKNNFTPIGTNLSAKAAAQRTIHFNSVEDAYNYSKIYGLRSFREQIVSSLASISRRNALATEWGVNAEMNMRNILKLIGNNARVQEDQVTLRALEGKLGQTAILGTPEQLLSEVLGKTRTPAQRNFWYQTNQWLVGLRSMASLGTSAISAQTDLVNLAGHLASISGTNPVMQMARVAKKYYTPNPKEYETISRQCGLMFQALRAQLVADRFGDIDQTGTVNKLTAMYFKLNALHFHDQRMSNVTAVMMANHFGDMAETPHASLPDSEKTWFARYGIGAKEWDGMRQTSFKGGDGNKYITPAGADQLKGVTPEEQDLIAHKFSSMFTDAANMSVPRAGARERLVLYRGTAPDTWEGTALRLAGLFKTFPVSMVTKILNRNIYGQSRGGLNTAMAVALNLAMVTIFGAAIYNVKQLITGKTAATPDTVKGAKTLLAKSFTQGGGAGYLGDIMLPEDDKAGMTANILKGIAGPILSDVGTEFDTLTKTVKGQEKLSSFEKDAVNTGANYVPFSNHFATKFLFNYYVKYAILNSIDPHYTDKMEKNMKKESGTSFIIPPAVNARK